MINMNLAKEALTETEFEILQVLNNKVNEYKQQQVIKSILSNFPLIINGTPGVGKSSMFMPIVVAVTGNHDSVQEISFPHMKPNTNALIKQEILRLKSKGYGDEMISAAINKAYNNNQDVLLYLKSLE